MDSGCKSDEELALLSRKWKHRRRIAYLSLFAVFIETILIMVFAVSGYAGDLKDFSSIFVTIIAGQISLVGAYMGLSTWKDS